MGAHLTSSGVFPRLAKPLELFLVLLTLILFTTASSDDEPDIPPGCPAVVVCPVLQAPTCDTNPIKVPCEKYADFSLHLPWLRSAQFAGFYAAQEMGYWSEECLNVVLHQHSEFDSVDEEFSLRNVTATLPDYLSFFEDAVTEDKELTHVSQHFRRSGRRIITSPVFEPEKTRGARALGDLKHITFGLVDVDWPKVPPIMMGLMDLENIELQPRGFGIKELMASSDQFEPIHAMFGMSYDDVGQLLAIPVNGKLLEAGVDFQVFDPAALQISTIEGGIVVDRRWLSDATNKVTLVKFLKGMHKGWIYCRENEDACVDFVTPQGQDSALKAPQRFMMHEINKLVWPAPYGIGVHTEESLCEAAEAAALAAGIINMTVPLEGHTTNMYARAANRMLAAEGLDVEGLYYAQLRFQARLPFCLNDDGVADICKTTAQKPAQKPMPVSEPKAENTTTTEDTTTIVEVSAFIATGCVGILLLAGATFLKSRYWNNSVPDKNMMMRRTPPGMLETDHPVTLVVTDIENSTALWDAHPDDMLVAQEMHDTCLRECLEKCIGYEVFTEGDSFTVAFHEPDHALKWCSLVQQHLNSLDWPASMDSCLLAQGCRQKSFLDQGPAPLPRESRRSLPSLIARPRSRRWSGGKEPREVEKSALSLDGILERMDKEIDITEENIRRCTMDSFVSPRGDCGGLKVRMGVHTATVKDLKQHTLTNRVIYPHDLIHVTNLVQNTPCGGQVVISSDTLSALQSARDSSTYGAVIHLGAHLLEDNIAPQREASIALVSTGKSLGLDTEGGPNMASSSGYSEKAVVKELFMLVPYVLSTRVAHYPPIKSMEQLSLGYFQAPPKESITIVFSSIKDLQLIRADFPDEAAIILEIICQCARTLLQQHNGYECEERDGGFMLAFHSAQDAILWALDLQERLLEADWPKKVLAHHACAKCVMMDTVMFNGPRVKVGMATGSVFKKTPSKTTGRADYFGPLLNHAARVKAHAQGGQVLVDNCSWEQVDHPSIRADFMGSQQFKGLKEPLDIYQVSQEESALKLRTYPVSLKSMEADEAASNSDLSQWSTINAAYIDEECPQDVGLEIVHEGVKDVGLGVKSLRRASFDSTYLNNGKTSAVHWSSRFLSGTLEADKPAPSCKWQQAGVHGRPKSSEVLLADISQKTSSAPPLMDGVMDYLETRPQSQFLCNKEEGELDSPHNRLRLHTQSGRRHSIDSASIAEDVLYDSRRGAWSAFGQMKVSQRKFMKDVHKQNPQTNRTAKLTNVSSAFRAPATRETFREPFSSPDRNTKQNLTSASVGEPGNPDTHDMMKISSLYQPSHAKDSFLDYNADAKDNKDAQFTSRRGMNPNIGTFLTIAEDVLIDSCRGSHEVNWKPSEFSNKEEGEPFINGFRKRRTSTDTISGHYHSLPSSFWEPDLLSPNNDDDSLLSHRLNSVEVKIDIVDDMLPAL